MEFSAETLPAFSPLQQTIAGQYVHLVPINQTHAEGLFAIGQEADDWAYMPRPCFSSLEDCKSWVSEAEYEMKKGRAMVFTLVQPDTQTPMGSSRYFDIQRPNRSLEIGWTWLGKDYQRTPVNTEAKLLLLSYALDDLKANRVQIKTDGRNLRSQKAIARIGAQHEGVLRSHMVVQNGFVRDTAMFSVIQSDWKNVKAQLNKMLGR